MNDAFGRGWSERAVNAGSHLRCHFIVSWIAVVVWLCSATAATSDPHRTFPPPRHERSNGESTRIASRSASTSGVTATAGRFDAYTQFVEVEFGSEEAARGAGLEIAPLWDDRVWAVSGRWDDYDPNHLRMRDELNRRGHRGTFYLNGWFGDWREMERPVDSSFAKALGEGGHSLGGHSLTHPWLSYCHRNRAFEEMAGIRMLLEAAADRPVLSYAFSYSNFRNEDEGDAVQEDLIQLLERAGYYHVANEPGFAAVPSGLMLSPILPADGAPMEAAAEAALADPAFAHAHPILTYAMHSLYRTDAAWEAFGSRLDRYGGRADWWYCHQNEYAAYRYQHRHARVAAVGATDGFKRVWRVERPVLMDLNDAIPITLRVAGVRGGDVRQVRCDTAEFELIRSGDGRVRLNLGHDRSQRLPDRIGLVPPNLENRSQLSEDDWDPDVPELGAMLHLRDGHLGLILTNRSGQTLEDVRVTYRLPLRWIDGIRRHLLGPIRAGGRLEDFWEPRPGKEGAKWTAGAAFLVAQVDYGVGGGARRLHVACRFFGEPEDPVFPQSGFRRLGPIPRDQMDVPVVLRDLAGGNAGHLRRWRIDDGRVLEWGVGDTPDDPPHFDVERLRLTGAWSGWGGQGYYVLRSEVVSERDQMALVRSSAAFVKGAVLNGEDVTGRGAWWLRAGTNRVALLCEPFPAIFFRLLDPETGERLESIRYLRPQPPPGIEVPYHVPPRPDEEPRQLWLIPVGGGRTQLEWATRGVLQSSPTLQGPWVDVPTTGRKHLPVVEDGPRFFRLRAP